MFLSKDFLVVPGHAKSKRRICVKTMIEKRFDDGRLALSCSFAEEGPK